LQWVAGLVNGDGATPYPSALKSPALCDN
jgi:hypothetical protein